VKRYWCYPIRDLGSCIPAAVAPATESAAEKPSIKRKRSCRTATSPILPKLNRVSRTHNAPLSFCLHIRSKIERERERSDQSILRTYRKIHLRSGSLVMAQPSGHRYFGARFFRFARPPQSKGPIPQPCRAEVDACAGRPSNFSSAA